jgi:hypothetical protein
MNAEQCTTIENENVVSIQEWKEKNWQKIEEKSLGAYLDVLSFNELLVEAGDTIHKLKDTYFSTELALQSKMLLSEFNKRVSMESKELSDSLLGMKKEIEKRINQITDLL